MSGLNFIRERLRKKYNKIVGVDNVHLNTENQVGDVLDEEASLGIFENDTTVSVAIIERILDEKNIPNGDEDILESGLKINLGTVPKEVLLLKYTLRGITDESIRRKIIREFMTINKDSFDEREHGRFMAALAHGEYDRMKYTDDKIDRYDGYFTGNMASCPFAGDGLKKLGTAGSEGDLSELEKEAREKLSLRHLYTASSVRERNNITGYEDDYISYEEPNPDGTYPSDRTEEDIAFEKKRRAEENQDDD